VKQFGIIYSAELLRRLRSRAFIVGLLFGGVGVALVTWLPSLIASVQFSEIRSIAVSGPPQVAAEAKKLLERSSDYTVRIVPVPSAQPNREMLERWHVGSLFELSEKAGRLRVAIYALDPSNVRLATIRGPLLPLDLALGTHRSPDELRRELDFPIVVRSVTANLMNTEESNTAHAIAFLMLFLLYMLIVFNSQLVLTSVAEEKTSRIAELLVSSTDLTGLLWAKILASTTLAVVQMATWVAIGFLLSFVVPVPSTGGAAGGEVSPFGVTSFSTVSPATIAGFIGFFVLGFAQTAVLFAGVGSLVNRTEDLGALSGPLFLPVIAAFVIAIMALSSPDAPFAVITSLVPILSPFVMFSRLAVSSVPGMQLLAAAVIDVLAVAILSFVGGRLYRVGMLLYGRMPSWPQIGRAIVGR
jgi:ABC-2 type transport system permease protein